jgi:hypothetical protein
VLDQEARLRPVALEEVERARGAVGQTDGVRMARRLGEPDRLGFVLGRLGESAELGKARDQEAAIVDRCWRDVSEILVNPVGGQRREVV